MQSNVNKIITWTKNKFLLNRECRDAAFRYDIPKKIYKMTNSCDDLWHTWN